MVEAHFAGNDRYVDTGTAVQNTVTGGDCLAGAPDPTSLREALAGEGGDSWLTPAA